jgi:hypothetical protein
MQIFKRVMAVAAVVGFSVLGIIAAEPAFAAEPPAPRSSPSGNVGDSYWIQYPSDGSMTWRVNAGGMPPGLTLEPNGVVHGVPTQEGEFLVNYIVNSAAGEYWGVTTFSIGPFVRDIAPINQQIVEVNIFHDENIAGLESGSFTGKCPPLNPYLTKREVVGRISPSGAIYTSSTGMAATAILTLDNDQKEEHGRTMRAHKGIQGTYTNWDIFDGFLSITLECTNSWDAAKYDVTK